jgi:branched-chain amino acid transport system permease protein
LGGQVVVHLFKGKIHRRNTLEQLRLVGPESLAIILLTVRLQDSRIGRAWMAIREDELAAQSMGINTRNVKLLAFALGASFGGVAGALFAAFQGFVSPESFTLMESVVIVSMVVLGGMGHVPGVILGALLLAGLPEALRHVAEHSIEQVGAQLRAMMPWIGRNKLVDQSRN